MRGASPDAVEEVVVLDEVVCQVKSRILLQLGLDLALAEITHLLVEHILLFFNFQDRDVLLIGMTLCER